MVHLKKNKNQFESNKTSMYTYKYNVKLQGLSLIFIFYLLFRFPWINVTGETYFSHPMYIFIFREDEACFAIVDMYKVRTYLIDAYILSSIFLSCVIYKRHIEQFLKGQYPFSRNVCHDLTCVSNNWVILSKSLFCSLYHFN